MLLVTLQIFIFYLIKTKAHGRASINDVMRPAATKVASTFKYSLQSLLLPFTLDILNCYINAYTRDNPYSNEVTVALGARTGDRSKDSCCDMKRELNSEIESR